ncbi:DegT/DnrJ/EryC1/StrS family aminotransferase [Stieleria varia]|uniref:dTDP-4-amino-4,6-dideoxy-D-glucose transaminase n=1 Tax=Stieleria varia TaxID=2528005 RepID=A0A5C6B0R0_9BACT|nr:DegT/DnrJ/EryC1/StrS family aminotransferase [Stieleria varia]TWU05753.1 dTDP-4-amino-4,6-dideoxy-D-glucose transaminase [Stieleria varia]
MNHHSVSWESSASLQDCRRVLEQIYENRYFTNHGPLAQRLESRLEELLGVGNVIAVGNESLALLIALAGFQVSGDVVVPAFCGQAAVETCAWLKLPVRQCDVDPLTHQPSLDSLRRVIDKQVAAVCLVETWGNRCDPAILQWLGEQGIAVVIQALDSFASRSEEGHVCQSPHVVTVFGLGPERIVSSLQGGLIATSDDALGEVFRNIRSSYGTRQKVDVIATCNGRFSEFQAGVGLRSLSRLLDTLVRNQAVAEIYQAKLGDVKGLSLYGFPGTVAPNHQCCPVIVSGDFSVTRNELVRRLTERGFPVHVVKPSCGTFPLTDRLQRELMLLPVARDSYENSEQSQRIATQVADAIIELA